MKLAKAFMVTSLVASLSACGSHSNILGLTVPESHKTSFEYSLGIAQAAYDSGDLQKARKYIENAYALNPHSERAAILFGFVYLSLAGADPFVLAKQMTVSDGSDEGSPAGTTDTLQTLQDSIGLTSDEMLSIGTLDETDPDLPIIVPMCAEKARSSLEKLRYLNRAIYAACPFVNEEALNRSDGRQNCELTKAVRRESAQAHFLWAFAHLTEALAFNSVLTYGSSGDDKKTNLEKRAAKLNAQSVSTPDEMTAFLEQLETIEETVSTILPTADFCEEDAPTTVLVATLQDMLAVDAGFKQIKAAPEKITGKLKKATARIAELQGGADKLSSLKSDMTKKLSAGLAEKLDALQSEGAELDPDQIAQICSSYGSISGGSEQKPVLCGGTIE